MVKIRGGWVQSKPRRLYLSKENNPIIRFMVNKHFFKLLGKPAVEPTYPPSSRPPSDRTTTPAPKTQQFDCMDNSIAITIPGRFPRGKECFVYFPDNPPSRFSPWCSKSHSQGVKLLRVPSRSSLLFILVKKFRTYHLHRG